MTNTQTNKTTTTGEAEALIGNSAFSANPHNATVQLCSLDVVVQAVRTVMNEQPQQHVAVKDEWLNTARTRQWLIDRGHRVRSAYSFKRVVENVERKKQGYEFWYKVSDLEKIPARKSVIVETH